ncbi:MAG: glycosyltransferase family 9 protein [Alphaproteobacteria bacterium]
MKNIIVQHKHIKNKWMLCLFGCPVYIKKYDDSYAYYSVFGIRILKKQKRSNGVIYAKDVMLNKNMCNVAVVLQGGLGDIIINANFLYLLRKKIGYENTRIDVYEPKKNMVFSVLKPGEIVNNVYVGCFPQRNLYDLYIDLSRLPILGQIDKKRVFALNPKLFEFVLLWIKDNAEKYRFIDNRPICDGILNKYCLLNGYKRWNQFDAEHKLGMTEQFPMPLFIDVSENKYLKSLKIPSKFITIHRGVDILIDSNSVKQWPVQYYNELIRLIREKYPDIFIVQLGDSKERCSEFDGVDLNLSGETSLEELKVLLKNSYLHIDNEGGMVHLRHALNGGKSIVLFGPTDPNVYGYSENINLVGRGCPGGCEWLKNGWQTRCALGESFPPCQYSLKPEVVFESFDKIMGE